jgi:uncharacterized protein (TIGR00725 family)
VIHVVAFGSSRAQPGDAAYELALATGRILGRRGLCVVSGGYAGTMAAISRGVREGGGRAIGITTEVFAQREPNAFLNERRSEADYAARLAALLRAGDLYLCLPGGLGTISEWVSAWCLATIGQLSGELWCFREPYMALASSIAARDEVGTPQLRHLVFLADIQELEARLDDWLARRPR